MESKSTNDKIPIIKHLLWPGLPGDTVFKRLFIISMLILSGASRAYAQSCTANAGGNVTVCGSTTTLNGTVSGTLGTLNSPLWTFVSGPATPTIVSPNSLTTNITGMTADGNYTFRLTRNCSTGIATSDVTITAHPRPASFTAGPDIKNVCATTGTTMLGGVIPAGFTGSWQIVNIYSLGRFGTTVSTNAQLSNATVATPTFSLINKANHDIDPAYYTILTITSADGYCSYTDTAIVAFPPNPQINPDLTTTKCFDPSTNGDQYFIYMGVPYLSTQIAGAAGTVANGTTVTMTVVSQPSGGAVTLNRIDGSFLYLDGINVSGSYVFKLTVTNSCGTYTTPNITYNFLGSNPHYVNLAPSGHAAPEQMTRYSFPGSGGELHCNLAGTNTPENFYFSIDPLDSPSVITTVTAAGIAPPGGFPTVSMTGAGTYNRMVTVTPPGGGWQVGTYRFDISVSNANGSCGFIQSYYIHVSDKSRPNVTVPDISVCYPGTGAVSATIPLPAIYQGVVNTSYFQNFSGAYYFRVVSKPVGSGTPTYTSSNLRSFTTSSTTISNLTMAGDYVFRINAEPTGANIGTFIDQEYACSGTSFTDTFIVHVENPINANAGSDQTLNCANSLTLLGNNQGTGTGLWTKVSSPAGSNPVIGSTSAANTTVTNVDVNGTYTYSWSITSQYGGCASRDTVSFVVSSLAPATPVTTVTDYSCAGTTGSIAINSPVGAAYEYSINGTTWQSAPIFSGLAGGAYTISVRYTGSSTCITTKNDTVKLAVCGTVFNDVNRNTIINSGENFTSLPAPMYVYLVNKATNLVIDSASVAANGTYTLKARANQNYMIELSTQKYAIGTNVVTTPVNTAPPTRYVTAGENKSGNNTGPGDGIPDGILDFVTVTTVNRSNMNFGITCASAGTGASTPLCANEPSVMQLSYFITGQDTGGIWTYATGSGITFNASAGTIQLTSTATNSTFQYAFPATAGCAASSSIATVTITPIPVNTRNITICQGDSVCVVNSQGTSLVLGAQQKVCYYTSGTYIDTLRYGAANGCDSVVITNLTVNVCNVNISGNVFNDANGNKILNAGETFSSLPAPLYVYLVNSSNVVIDSAVVAANGSYTLQGPPSQNYTLELSTIKYAPGINVTTTPIVNTPPAGWVTTGENGANNTGSGDGTPNGVLPITVGTSTFTNANFGIEQPSTAVNDASSNNTYGSAVTVNVVSNDTDPAPGTIDVTRVSMVTPGTATNVTTDAAGDVVSMTIPGEGVWTVNTTTGAMTFTPQLGYIGNPTPVQYTVRDNAGALSNAATVTITYNAPVQITGSVFNDANGNKVLNPGETFSSLPAPLYVYLVNSSNVIMDSARVAANGSYALQAPPSQSYTLQLSTQQYPLGTNTGTTPISKTPPTGWVTTGENGNNNTGSGDGTPDGSLAVTLGTADLSNQNFGIEQPPAATNDIGSTAVVGGPVTINVLANDTDPAPGTLDAASVSMVVPSGATNVITDDNGDVISMTIPNQGTWTVNTTTGAITFTPQVGYVNNPTSIQYTVDDNAGVPSNPATVSIITPVAQPPVFIAGSVFDDANGNTVINTGETLTSLPVPLNVYLVNSAGIIVTGSPVASDGSYSLSAKPDQTYTIMLTTKTYSLNTSNNITPIDKTPPANWVTTGENINNNTGTGDGTPDGMLAVTVAAANISNANFGMEQKPAADAKSFSIPASTLSATAPGNFSNQPGYKSILTSSPVLTGYSTGGSLSGTDPEDCAAASSCNTGTGTTFSIATINANTKLYYDFGGSTGVKEITPSSGNPVLIPNYDASKLLIMIQDGTTNPAGFTYSMVDKAGVSGTAVSYSIQFRTSLPVTYADFTASKVNSTVALKWITTSELNSKGFEVEKSNDGKNWQVFDFMESKKANSAVLQQYTTTDIAPYTGINYYRLKQVDLGGSFAYSNIRSVMFAATDIQLSPNPVTDVLFVKGLPSGTSEIHVVTTLGVILKVQKAETSSAFINMKELAQGTYFIVVKLENGELKKYKVLKN